jgi:hypothetical protein
MLSIIVRGRDSIIELALLENDVLVPSTGVERCDLVLKRSGMVDQTVSSIGVGQEDWFDLQYPAVFGGRQTTVVRVNLAGIDDPPPDGRCEGHVFLWDQEHTNGRFWGTINLEIRATPPEA